MVKYLSKFVLEVLPSVFATVVGAYIVAHYINPKPETPKTAVVATAPAAEAKDADTTDTVEDKAADAQSGEASGGDVKSGEVKSGEVKSGEVTSADAKAADAKPADVKPADIKSADVKRAEAEPAKVETAKARVAKPEEKKNAIELARAAIERLRGTTVDVPTKPAPPPVRAPAETARADEGPRVPVQAPAPQRSQPVLPVATTGLAPQSTPANAAAPPPLPPPVIVASPYGRHSVGPEAPVAAAPAEQPASDQASADRPTPPADIPFQRGYGLQAQAAPVEHVSIAEHVLSTTRSFFRALTPNNQPN
jgi:hypothetical protein